MISKKRNGHIYLLPCIFKFYSYFFLLLKMYKWINCVIHCELCGCGVRATEIAMSKFIALHCIVL